MTKLQIKHRKKTEHGKITKLNIFIILKSTRKHLSVKVGQYCIILLLCYLIKMHEKLLHLNYRTSTSTTSKPPDIT